MGDDDIFHSNLQSNRIQGLVSMEWSSLEGERGTGYECRGVSKHGGGYGGEREEGTTKWNGRWGEC